MDGKAESHFIESEGVVLTVAVYYLQKQEDSLDNDPGLLAATETEERTTNGRMDGHTADRRAD